MTPVSTPDFQLWLHCLLFPQCCCCSALICDENSFLEFIPSICLQVTVCCSVYHFAESCCIFIWINVKNELVYHLRYFQWQDKLSFELLYELDSVWGIFSLYKLVLRVFFLYHLVGIKATCISLHRRYISLHEGIF